ncbi:MAG: hypothetical protein H6Q89_4030 [Myxococcaceae bacterium]|nr:hypothetical protein [Myxococcaceae bacterium]
MPMSLRGQSMVVFAICLLLLTLMVTITLSFGTMAKEKMEIQQAADQAAWSQAIATARTFNEIAVYNRAQLGQMVSLLGVESALSYAAWWRAYVSAMLMGYFDVRDQLGAQMAQLQRNSALGKQPDCNSAPCTCKELGLAMKEVQETRIKPLYDTGTQTSGADQNHPYGGEYERLFNGWQPVDTAAGEQVRTLQGYAAAFHGAQTDAFDRVLIAGNLQDSKLARALVGRAAAGSREWAVVDESVSLREVNAAVLSGGDNLHAVRAAMGTRGHPFVTRRLGGAATLTAAMNALIPLGPNEGPITEPAYKGSSYFGPLGYPVGHSNTVATSNQSYAWGDDHIQPFRVGYRNTANAACSRTSSPRRVFSYVKSTDKDELTDQHGWDPTYAPDEADPPTERHTTAPCRVYLPAGGWTSCVSVWVTFMDYQPAAVANKGDAFGQPKTFAAVKRDYSVRTVADPWNLAFKFRFAASSSGTAFALRGSKAQPQAGSNRIILTDGTDISTQSAVSTGIAYYHRADHWKEPPNLFNPFWRAGLVHADVDATGEADFRSQISKAAPWAADAYLELRAQGWAGIP